MAAGLVEVRGVHKAYGTLEVLDGIDLTVQPGEVTVILGPSGSGKSTLLRAINHLEKVDRGLISRGRRAHRLPRGVPTARCRSSRRRTSCAQRTRIGFVFQNFNLFPHLTALENVVEAPDLGPGPAARPRSRPRPARCSTASGWPTRPTPTRGSCPAGSSSAWPSPGRSRSSRRSCSSTSRRPRSTRSSSARCSTSSATSRATGTTLVVVTHEIGFAREVATRSSSWTAAGSSSRAPPAQVLDAPQHDRTRAFLDKVL